MSSSNSACDDQHSAPKSTFAATAVPVVADSPSLVIGVADGDPDYEFSDISAVTRRADGTIVVADRGSSSIRFFDERGKLIRRVGRNGGGPGEYVMLGYFIPLDDGFLVTDWRAPRLSLLNEKGKYLRSFTEPVGPTFDIDSSARGISAFRYYPVGMIPPYMVFGRYVHPSSYPLHHQARTVWRDTIEYMLVELPARDGMPLQLVRTIATALGRPVVGAVAHTRSGYAFLATKAIHFTAGSELAIGRDRMYVADSDSMVIRVYATNGTPLPSIRDDVPLPPVTAADIAADKSRLAGGNTDEKGRRFPSSEMQRYVSWYYDNVPLPKTKPVRSRLIVDANDNLWVQDYEINAHHRAGVGIAPILGDDSPWWTIFNANGKKLGRVKLPDGVRVHEIGKDYLLGIATDELDVQTVVMYHLLTPRPRGVQ